MLGTEHEMAQSCLRRVPWLLALPMAFIGFDARPRGLRGLRAEPDVAERLGSEEARAAWLAGLEEVDWDEVKMVLGLLWKRASREGRDGGPLGYPMTLTRLEEGVYDEDEAMLVADVEARLTQVPEGDPQEKSWKWSVVSSCFRELGFVRQGL